MRMRIVCVYIYIYYNRIILQTFCIFKRGYAISHNRIDDNNFHLGAALDQRKDYQQSIKYRVSVN